MPFVIIIFVTALFIGLPMAFVLGLGGLAHIIALNTPEYMSVITQRLFVGVNSYSLMCIPFFVLAGDLMNKGGITQRLLAFSREAIGWINGGMAYCCVIMAMVLSAILGSANAVTAILCAILISEMSNDGYDEDFTGSLIAASGVLGTGHTAQRYLYHLWGAYGSVRSKNVRGRYRARHFTWAWIYAGDSVLHEKKRI